MINLENNCQIIVSRSLHKISLFDGLSYKTIKLFYDCKYLLFFRTGIQKTNITIGYSSKRQYKIREDYKLTIGSVCTQSQTERNDYCTIHMPDCDLQSAQLIGFGLWESGCGCNSWHSRTSCLWHGWDIKLTAPPIKLTALKLLSKTALWLPDESRVKDYNLLSHKRLHLQTQTLII